MAYKVIILYQLYMPSYFLGTFTEYPEGKAERFNGLLPGKIPATALYAEKYKFEIIPQYRHGPFEMSLHCSFCNIHLCCNFFDLFLLDNMK